MSNVNLKGNLKLKKNSKKSSKRSSKKSSKRHSSKHERIMDVEDEIANIIDEKFDNNVEDTFMGNPENLEFDPLHVNYIIPSYDNLNINNYGISFDKMMGSNQNQFLKNTVNNKFMSMQTQPMQSQPMQSQVQSHVQANNFATDSEIFSPPQSGGGMKNNHTFRNTRTLRKY